MNNKKAFTLVEMITVITLIGLIGLIVIPVFEGVVKRNKDKMYERQVDYLIAQAKTYVTDNPSEITEDVSYICISKIIEEGYYSDSKIKDPRDDSEIEGKIKVTYVEESQTYLYEYIEDNTDC